MATVIFFAPELAALGLSADATAGAVMPRPFWTRGNNTETVIA